MDTWLLTTVTSSSAESVSESATFFAVADLRGETFGRGVGDTGVTSGEADLDLGVEGLVVDSDLENVEI